MKLDYSLHIFEKYLNVKFHENVPSGRRVVPCGQTDVAKLNISFS